MSEEEEQGKFVVKKVTKLSAFGVDDEIPESDLTIQTKQELIQLDYVDPEDNDKKVIIKPGCFSIEEGAAGPKLTKFDLRVYELLETIDNTSMILNESDKFFNKLDVYKKLEREAKRAILIASAPGVGKTAAINKVCRKFLEEEGTCVMIWDTSSVESATVNRLFLSKSKFHKTTKRLILIMEDIGGGSVEDYHGSKGADSSLLNLLDGVGNPFNDVPTFIIATTNNPEQSVAALIDRPGRFDRVIEMKAPDEKECEELLRFISKQELSDKDKEAAKLAAKNEFSIAHLQEIVVRSLLDDTSMLVAAKELVAHKKRFKDAFQDTKKMGMGFNKE